MLAEPAPTDPLELIAALTEQNRSAPDPAIEEQLVRLRHEAFPSTVGPPPPFAEVRALPGDPGPMVAVRPADLSVDTLRHGLAAHGCLHVAGLLDQAQVAELTAGIDRAIAAFDQGLAGAPAADTTPWYVPFVPPPGSPYKVVGRANWVRASGGVLTADSPRMLFRLCELVDATGIGELVTDYFGERPALSVTKNTLRRVSPHADTNWHQDGAFLGAEVRSLNLWIALTTCGVDAPGLDIVPRRFDEVLSSGTDGATFDWSVAPDVVSGASGPSAVECPTFEAGDALLFDHLFLHRTAVSPSMTRDRHAIECWLFAPSAYPPGEIPLAY